MHDLEIVAPAFVDMAHRIVWCTAASVDAKGRPRSRVLHPIWEWRDGELVGWIATSPTRTQREHLAVSPYLSLNYWHPSDDTCVAECRVEWCFDGKTRERVWETFKSAPAPGGYDPAIIPTWESPASDAFAALRLEPWRLRVFSGAALLGRGEEVLVWEERAAERWSRHLLVRIDQIAHDAGRTRSTVAARCSAARWSTLARASMRVELTEASIADAPVLANLLSLYLHDFSEVFSSAPGPDGRFAYERLPLYFEEPGRTAFLIRCDGALAGFALVSRGSMITSAPDVWDLTEFFVARGLRRRGVGRMAASAVFDRFPGAWEVRALDRNPGAAEFWTRAISQHTGGAFEVRAWPETGPEWKVFRFSQSEALPAPHRVR